MVLELPRRQQPSFLAQLDHLCRHHGLWLFNVTCRTNRPTFTQPACLTPIPVSQAVLALLPHFQGGYQSTLLQRHRPGAAWLYQQLAAFLTQARCYQLTVGPLDEMSQLVEQLFDT